MATGWPAPARPSASSAYLKALVRRYLPDLLERVVSGAIEPGLVFGLTLPLDDIAEAY